MTILNQTTAHIWENNFWGPVTATLDWCEANYQFSRYIAETANTFSNIGTIFLACYGAQQVISAKLPSRYLAGYAGFGLVGLGSLIFHATLLYEAQLADELPMIYVATYCSAILLDTHRGYSLQNTRAPLIIASFFLFNVLFTWSYAVYRNPIYHQVVFATIMLITTLRTVYLLHYSEVSQRIPQKARSTIGRIFAFGVGTFAFGFFIWNLDNIFCNTLTHWKQTVGWPTAFLLEGHSWWHIFTALGTYLMLIGNTYLTLCIKDDHSEYTLVRHYGLPGLKRVGKSKTQ